MLEFVDMMLVSCQRSFNPDECRMSGGPDTHLNAECDHSTGKGRNELPGAEQRTALPLPATVLGQTL